MSNELRGETSSGETCKALLSNPAGKFWNGSSFETFASGNYATYLIAVTELGTTGIYYGDFPTAIVTSGTYEFFIKRQAGGSPAQDDAIVSVGHVDWSGTASVAAVTGSMSATDWRDYVLRGGFKRTDKDTELYEETTDAIQELRRRFMFDEAEAEITSTDTISVLGDFKFDVESDLGLLLGIVVEDGANATSLKQRTKDEFDDLYPDINVTSDKGYPLHFCIYAGQVRIGPIPDRITYSYRVSYSRRAGTITSTSTGVPFTKDYRDILRDLTRAKLEKGMDEFDVAAQFMQYFENAWDSIKRRERSTAGEGSFNVKPFGM